MYIIGISCGFITQGTNVARSVIGFVINGIGDVMNAGPTLVEHVHSIDNGNINKIRSLPAYQKVLIVFYILNCMIHFWIPTTLN
jgi:hypothetical protein